MADQEITLTMPEELILNAENESAKRGISISVLMREMLERGLRTLEPTKEDADKAAKRFLELAKQHPIEMPEKLWKREDLYE
jgi:hypothetical protein